jgi:transposase, IS30 family
MRSHSNPSTAKSKLPGMRYTRLTQNERYQIHILSKTGHDQSETARMLERSKLTNSRALKRNCAQCGYRPKQAQEFSLARMRVRESGRCVFAETWAFVDAKPE